MFVDIGLYVTYALIGICVLGILIFAVGRIVSHPSAAKSALIGIGGLVVLWVLAYLFSTGDDAAEGGMYAGMGITEGTSHMVGAGLVTFYLLLGIVILTILFNELTRLFK